MKLTIEQKKAKVRNFRPIDDGTDNAELMACFTKKEVKRLKETEEGLQAVSEIMRKYENIAIMRDHIERIKKLIQKGCAKEFILDLDYAEEEYAEAEQELLQPK